MKGRTRFKASAIYHAEPDLAKCFMTTHEVLENKLKKGKLTKEEIKKLADYRVEHTTKSRVKHWFVPCFGTLIEVPKDVYDRYMENQKQYNYV